MSNTNVTNHEYTKFQENIYALYEGWNQKLASQSIVEQKNRNHNHYPLLPQLQLNMDVQDYRSFLNDLFAVLKDYQSSLNENISHLETLLNDEVLNKWFTEAIAVNTYYFNEFAKEFNLPDWLPMFAAEHAARPYLQKAAAELKDRLKETEHWEGCPVCGEPPRLALMNQKGKKEITCPRCHFSWPEKKISCAHCGTDDHEQIVILHVEGEDSANLYACKKCNGYTKVIDVNKMIKVPPVELLDLKTIHLDYIAQEKGYGVKDGESH